MKYNGHDYEIKFCDPSEDWGEFKGLFCIDCAIADNEFYQFYSTYAEAEAKAKRNIDDFVEAIPQTKQEWLNAIDSCIIRTGYEDYHLDEVMVWDLLQKAALYLKPDNMLAVSDENRAMSYATTLATAIHAKHYPEVTRWEPLPDLLGVLTQIDNMTDGLTRAATDE